MLTSPFSVLNKPFEKKLTFVLLLLLLLTISAMFYFDSFLKNDVAEYGIVSFELAKNIDSSVSILNSWNEKAKTFAGLSMGFDFLFLIIYASLIAILIHRLNEQLWKGKTFYRLGVMLIWLSFAAAIFDVIENIALIKLLTGNLKQVWSSLAYYFAIPKFLFVILGILYIIINFLYRLIKK